MPKLRRITAEEGERILLNAGFLLLRSKGIHRIYKRENKRVTLPFHTGKMLHPKIIKQVHEAIK